MNRFFPNLSFHSKAHQIAIAVIAGSIIQGLLGHSNSLWLLFAPHRVLFSFEIWRPFTSLFVAISPAEIIFGSLIIYSIGGMLESRWRPKRFLAVTLGIPLIAHVLILALAIILPATFLGAYYPGARQIVTTLWIIYGLAAHFSHERLNFWGTPVTGKTFALIGLGFVVLSAVFSGVMPVLPELFTALLCYVYMYRHTVRYWKNQAALKYYDWKLKKLRSRSNFKVIPGSKTGGTRASDKFSDDEDESNTGPQIH